MTRPSWTPDWLRTSIHTIAESEVWRGVEAQSFNATTLLVDSFEEHDLLENLLEGSKPPLPRTKTNARHFLITTPFRYTPLHDSRFRPAGLHGIWYGARTLTAACAEVAYWRMRFILDSAALVDEKIVTSHTFFSVAAGGLGIDLAVPPWEADREFWIGNDYAETHRLSAAAEATGIAIIQYESVRAPGHACFAIFTPDAIREPRGGLDATRQGWSCTATRDFVMIQSEDDLSQRFEWRR
jgi:hypothetical protein